jgi:hypothetical protein
MGEAAEIFQVDVGSPLTRALAESLRNALALEFFGLARPHEATVGHRILRTDGDDTAAICVTRWPDGTGFSIELITSIPTDDPSSYRELRDEVIRALRTIVGDKSGLLTVRSDGA